MRVVIDTNLLISGVISSGPPRELLNAAKAGVFELCTSEVSLSELLDVLGRPKFTFRLGQAEVTPHGIVDALRALAIVVAPTIVPPVVSTDPDDDHVLAAALTGAADLIVSGDKRDLLPLGSYQGMPIITAREALDRLGLGGE